jgi:DNA-binding NtrC family response regulator/ligand-binding sensor domain-containing protein
MVEGTADSKAKVTLTVPLPRGVAVQAGTGQTVPAGPGIRQGLWQTFGVSDGVPVAGVKAILQDCQGRMWFGTGYWMNEPAALSRYDGASWTTFTREDGLPGNRVRRITEDCAGALWLATDAGAVRYDGQTWTPFTTAEGLAHSDVRDILQDRTGALWCGTQGGVSRYDGQTWSTFTAEDGLPGSIVCVIYEDRQGNLWAGAESGGLVRYDGHRWRSFATLGASVADIWEDSQGNLWVATWGRGVSRYDGAEWTSFTVEDGLAENRVTAIWQESEGHLWFATYSRGVSRYDGRTWTTFTTADGLANEMILALAGDQEGGLWFGAVGGGISRYHPHAPTSYTTADGLAHNVVMSLLEDRHGCLWFATWGGVSRYDGETWVSFTEKDGLLNDLLWAIVEDRQGHIWVGNMYKGASRYDGEGWTCFTPADGLGGAYVNNLLLDREGKVWVSSEDNRVSRYDGERWRHFTAEDGLAEDDVYGMWQDRQGCLWLGSSRAIRVYDGVQFRIVKEGVFGLVPTIREDRRGQMWFGTTAGGLYRCDGREWAQFTTREGLAHNQVISLLEDDRGILWIGTFGGGINLYDGLVFQHLTRVDGLAHNMVQKIIQAKNGDILIATEGGVTRYTPSRTPPSIHIVAVVAERNCGPVDQLEMPSSQDYLRFEFQGASLQTPPNRMMYVYRLRGYQEEWQVTRAERAEYTGLPIGQYLFEVKAVDRDLNYSGPVAVRVSVVPDPLREALSEALSAGGASGDFLGESEALRGVQQQLARVAPTDMTVLIQGETGTGKGLAARTLHRLSRQAAGPFIQVNCGGLPESLVESELFGHEKGAFTGAISRKLGKVELAREGTLFLDEIGDLPLNAQVKLLRLLEERTFERVGGTQTLRAEARVIAATNRDLRQMIAQGQFRQDLYYRIEGFSLKLPPLRERREDILLLALYFMEKMAAHLDKEVAELAPEALALLQAYAWPGNVRELEHALQRAVIVCREPIIRAADLALGPGTGVQLPLGGDLTPEEYERQYIRKVLEQTDWVIKGSRGAAARLGLSASGLRRRMEKLGIRRE